MTNTNRQQTTNGVGEIVATVKSAFETPEWYFNKLNYRVRLRGDIVRGFARNLNFHRYIDIGCGDGSISLPLLNVHRQLTLQDISSAMLARASARVPAALLANVDLVLGDFRDAGLGQGTYDLVICLGVLAYIEDAQAFISRLAGLLRAGGVIMFECTDRAHLLSRLLASYSAVTARVRRPKVQVPVYTHTKADVTACFGKLGFEQLGQYSYSTPLPVIRSFISQDKHYRMIARLHGTPEHNRAAWFGSEHIFFYRKPGRFSVECLPAN